MTNKEQKLRNVLYLVLSVAIAVSVWYYVDESSGHVVTQSVSGVPIEYTNESSLTDKGLMLVQGEESGTDTAVDFVFRGTRRHIVQLDRSKVRVTADLSGVTEAGVQTVKFTPSYTDRKFDSTNTTIAEQSIYLATVNICELSHKEVELRCELTGNVAEGYSAGKVQLSRNTIQIRGQESDIAPVSYAKVTFDIGRNAKETVTAELSCLFYDEDGQVVSSTNIHADETKIQATLPVYVTKELKLLVDFQDAPGARLEDMVWAIKPESIVVSGDASILNNMTGIVLDSFDLLGVTTENTSHSYAILVPDGCENLSGVTRATLDIGYPDRTVVELTTQNFLLENAPANRVVELLTDEMTVQLFGTASVLEGITGDQIAIVADLSDYAVASGTYMVPAQVLVADEASVGVAGTYQVQIRIPEEEE